MCSATDEGFLYRMLEKRWTSSGSVHELLINYKKAYIPSKLTEAVMLLTCIGDVLGSNLDRTTDWPYWGFLLVFSVVSDKQQDSTINDTGAIFFHFLFSSFTRRSVDWGALRVVKQPTRLSVRKAVIQGRNIVGKFHSVWQGSTHNASWRINVCWNQMSVSVS
jgi:hypothetical protein